jgi:hypothetical protein
LIDESLKEFPRAIVADVAIIINEIRLERDVDVAALLTVDGVLLRHLDARTF